MVLSLVLYKAEQVTTVVLCLQTPLSISSGSHIPLLLPVPTDEPHIHQGLVLQLSLTPPAPRVGSAPLPGWAHGDAKHKLPQCDFWQRWSFWLQIYHQDLSLHLAAFPYPCSHKTLKCSDMILGYPQNSPPAIHASDSIFYKM